MKKKRKNNLLKIKDLLLKIKDLIDLEIQSEIDLDESINPDVVDAMARLHSAIREQYNIPT